MNTTDTLRAFEIRNTRSGLSLGVYEGETGEAAIAAMLADAGCDDAADAALEAVEV